MNPDPNKERTSYWSYHDRLKARAVARAKWLASLRKGRPGRRH